MAFPTLASAMTGYVARTAAYVKDAPGSDGNYILFNEFDVVAYVIHDAWRINKTGDLLVSYGPTSWDPITGKEAPLLSEDGGIPSNKCGANVSWPGCELFVDTSHYVTEYGFYGLTQEPSVWAGKTQLRAPALNITAFFLGNEVHPTMAGRDWVHPITKEKPFLDPAKVTYMVSNRTYNLSYVQQYGACQPDSDVYQWGFSYIQLFILLVLLLAWTLGIWAIWLKAHINLPLASNKHAGEVPRGRIALLHLAFAMQRDLSVAGIDPTPMTDGQLGREIHQRVKGGGMVWLASADGLDTDPLDGTITTAITDTRKPDVLLGGFLWQKTKELKWVLLAFISYFSATVYGATCLYALAWPLFVVSWLCCFGLYGFFFAGRMRWLLWVYVPCTCILGTVVTFMARRALFMKSW
ncbi:predicted protein [Chaetomium globosum CBS 148.51]|uniref:Uncharacterized protein n=1 Tax=Chaetomium globosum (strain ATCC 6205 / CBS 148.51 / DSM 1962 / NBRC 6347 / NRRL 1970) TaxID=306901 RepID=Q2GM28_CHAGB|nr:uncharacterized protein CHGG_10976 [Chaetomium globosum CBS 148.51]EAQ83158.1 predicted protein [Chaetomium globosum CBS 148.51]